MKAGELFVAGQWQAPLSGETYQSINPASEEPVAAVAEGDERDIDAAVAAARKAFDDGPPRSASRSCERRRARSSGSRSSWAASRPASCSPTPTWKRPYARSVHGQGHSNGASRVEDADGNRAVVHRIRQARGRPAGGEGRPRGRRQRQGLLRAADHLRWCHERHEDRGRGDLWTGALGHPVPVGRGRHRSGQPDFVRARRGGVDTGCVHAAAVGSYRDSTRLPAGSGIRYEERCPSSAVNALAATDGYLKPMWPSGRIITTPP